MALLAFTVPLSVFCRVEDKIERKGILIKSTDAIKEEGIYPKLRITAALRKIAYGTSGEAQDEYIQMSEDSVLVELKKFCHEIMMKSDKE